jgi:hypothetical protein
VHVTLVLFASCCFACSSFSSFCLFLFSNAVIDPPKFQVEAEAQIGTVLRIEDQHHHITD